jgi:membrane protease YdiL (CAAX protease family)
MWIVTSPDQLITDFSDYPTPAYRISLVVMGALVSGVVEEAAFRGYLQSRLEEFGPTYAILVTSAVFVLAHVTHGVVAMLLMAPGYFVASLLYGALAWRTGSILPGMALHVTGDFLHTMFVLLGGDLRALTMSG